MGLGRCVVTHIICTIMKKKISCTVVFNNTRCPCPAIFFVSNHTECCLEIFREFAHLYCMLQDMDNVQNAVNPLSVL